MDGGPTGAGFAQLGWAPNGTVHFNYAVAVGAKGNEYTASAGADLDGDGTPQQWGYKRGNQNAKDLNGGGLCDQNGLTLGVVSPCSPNHGRTIF